MDTRTPRSARPRAAARSRRALRLPLFVLLIAALAQCAAWSAARLAGADRFPELARPLVPVLAFTPYAALVSVAVVCCAAALRRWTTCAIAVVVAGAFTGAVLPRAVGDPAPAAAGPPLRVLSANMRFGHADPRVLVDLVRRGHVDVLSLQEFTAESALALDRAGLRALLPYRLTKPIGGALGSALFARYPLRALPAPPLAVVGLALPRARVEVPGATRVEVMAVHLARPLNEVGVVQWARGLASVPAAQPHGAVRILAGDFNGTLDNARVRGLLATGYVDAADSAGAGLVPTFRKRAWPPITIDHVLVDARCAVRRVTVHDLPHSDHRAVYAELRLP